MSSPLLGISTLITSAPRSLRFIEQKGPASTRDRSSTLMPFKGGSDAVIVMSEKMRLGVKRLLIENVRREDLGFF